MQSVRYSLLLGDIEALFAPLPNQGRIAVTKAAKDAKCHSMIN